MCANYVPLTRGDWMLRFFGIERDFKAEVPPDAYPLHQAPFIRLADAASGGKPIAELGQFGLLPAFATELAYGRKTYNARSETVHSKPSFKEAWRRGQRCIIPAEAVYEPRYNDDLTVERWMIQQPGGLPMGLAGVYDSWTGPDGRKMHSFAMLTVNADTHAFYRQFHAPGEEKRMVVILDPKEYEAWLSCPVAEARNFFRQWQGPLEGFPRARPPRVVKAADGEPVDTSAAPAKRAKPPKPAPPETRGLFD